MHDAVCWSGVPELDVVVGTVEEGVGGETIVEAIEVDVVVEEVDEVGFGWVVVMPEPQPATARAVVATIARQRLAGLRGTGPPEAGARVVEVIGGWVGEVTVRFASPVADAIVPPTMSAATEAASIPTARRWVRNLPDVLEVFA
ncbi:MAG: hypothetical protein M3063_09355 [Actinomycetota bacterium]|nr:hypothetical protein [Actinomycetota bacterium]